MSQEQGECKEVSVGDVRIRVSITEPVAVVRCAGQRDVIASWPDLRVGSRAPVVSLRSAPTGAWVVYLARRTEAELLAEKSEPAARGGLVHIALDGSLTLFPERTEMALIGATRHGAWLSVRSRTEDVDDEAAWLADHTIVVLTPRGETRKVVLDRVPMSTDDDGTVAVLYAFTSAPLGRQDRNGTSYTYPELEIPLSEVLPTRIRVADSEHRLLDAAEWNDPWSVPAAPLPSAPEDDDPSAAWSLIDLPPEEGRAATDAVLEQFEDLEAYWTRAVSGITAPLAPGISEPRVEVVGQWPHTRVDVSFRLIRYPDGRVRRSMRVFDSAGRIENWEYAAVNLMEAIHQPLPPLESAIQGVLDI